MVDTTGGDPPASETIEHRDILGSGSPPHRGGVVLDLAHALDTASQHQIARSGLDQHGGVDHRLDT